MRYEIITGEGEAELERLVNEKLREGWRPQGGLAIHIRGQSSLFMQAMVDEQDPERERARGTRMAGGGVRA